MGGRGASGGTGGKHIASIEKSIREKDYYKNSYDDGQKLLTSAYFMGQVKSDIGKEAFNRDYEITTKQVDAMAAKLVGEIKSQKQKRADVESTELAQKTREAKEYFARTYNPNRPAREITSSTYKRAQNRLTRGVNNWFGSGMGGKKGN